MNTDYKVGDFIYDADIYDGLNKFLSDLEFYLKSASNLNGNLNCSKELEHYAS